MNTYLAIEINHPALWNYIQYTLGLSQNSGDNYSRKRKLS